LQELFDHHNSGSNTLSQSQSCACAADVDVSKGPLMTLYFLLKSCNRAIFHCIEQEPGSKSGSELWPVTRPDPDPNFWPGDPWAGDPVLSLPGLIADDVTRTCCQPVSNSVFMFDSGQLQFRPQRSRSFILVPIDSSYATSYRLPIVTFVLGRTV